MMGAFLQENPAKLEKLACYELRSCVKPSLDLPSFDDRPYPPGTVLIRTIAASICGSDFVGKGPDNSCHGCCWRQSLDALGTFTCGGTGHELLGEIVQIVEPCKYPVGQRVLAFPPIYFKQVFGDKLRRATGLVDLDSIFETKGGFAEYFVSHDAVCVPVPKVTPPIRHNKLADFDPRWFVLAQPLGTVLHACQHLDGNLTGKTVAVVGQGQNGFLMTQLLAGHRPRRLIVLDLLPDRLEVAQELYAITHAIHVTNNETMIQDTHAKIMEITNGELCDVVVDMVGHPSQTMEMCCELTKAYGTVLLFGIPPAQDEPQFTISTRTFHRNLKLITSHSPPMETFELAMELLEQGRFDPTGIFTHTIPFHESFPEAYEIAQNYQDGVIKVLVTFDEGG